MLVKSSDRVTSSDAAISFKPLVVSFVACVWQAEHVLVSGGTALMCPAFRMQPSYRRLIRGPQQSAENTRRHGSAVECSGANAPILSASGTDWQRAGVNVGAATQCGEVGSAKDFSLRPADTITVTTDREKAISFLRLFVDDGASPGDMLGSDKLPRGVADMPGQLKDWELAREHAVERKWLEKLPSGEYRLTGLGFAAAKLGRN
jgi:hypothetical protein